MLVGIIVLVIFMIVFLYILTYFGLTGMRIYRADKLSIKVACVGDSITYVFFFTTCIKIIIQKFQVRCLTKNIALIISA